MPKRLSIEIDRRRLSDWHPLSVRVHVTEENDSQHTTTFTPYEDSLQEVIRPLIRLIKDTPEEAIDLRFLEDDLVVIPSKDYERLLDAVTIPPRPIRKTHD